MSNALVIATVTASLKQILQTAVSTAVPGAGLTTVRPTGSGNGVPHINLFLYQIIPHAAGHNAAPPTAGVERPGARRFQTALDLHYLLTFYGEEERLEPQRLLETAMRTLYASPVLTRDMIRATLDTLMSADPHHFLKESALAEQPDWVKFTPLALDLKELSELWAGFFQSPYALSLAYKGTVVLTEGEPVASIPSRDTPSRDTYVTPFRQPIIEQVLPQMGADQTVLAGSTLLIRGKQLQSDNLRVRLCGQELQPVSVSDTEVCLPLASPPFAANSLRAGVQAVQLVYPPVMDVAGELHGGIESNVAAFVLRPRITAVTAARSQIILQVNPMVGSGQRVTLLLNERSAAAPASYAFVTLITADTNVIRIPLSGMRSAEYFLRLQVDGAESPLDLDPASPMFGPTVMIQ